MSVTTKDVGQVQRHDHTVIHVQILTGSLKRCKSKLKSEQNVTEYRPHPTSKIACVYVSVQIPM